MSKRAYDWKRFWCAQGVEYKLDDDGFLVEPEGEYAKYFQPHVLSFDKLVPMPCLALLGEPGMGKSTALEDAEAAAREAAKTSGGQVLKIDLKEYDSGDQIIQDVFENDVYRNWLAGVTVLELFIDSLDECLLRVSSIANLLAGQFRRRKPPADRLRLRIACRTAEWPHSLGKAMEDVWSRDAAGIYQLMPLREADVATAAAVEAGDADGFLRTVRERRVGPLASKPVTLGFLLQTYKAHRELPKTQAELYRSGCRFLVTETAPTRKEAGLLGRLSPDERFAVAARIAAVTVLSNRPVVYAGETIERPSSDVTVPELTGAFNEIANGLEIRVDEAAVREVLATSLFDSAGPGRRSWAHRTYAEFLTAEYLLRHDLKAPQLQGLLMGGGDEEARVVPQLEETAGWLAGMSLAFREQISANDPQVLLRSDVSTVEDAGRKAVVANLLSAFEEGKLVRLDLMLHDRLRRLAHPDLAAQLEPYVRDPGRDFLAREMAMELAEECNVKAVQGALAHVALDAAEDTRLRIRSAEAVATVGDDETKQKLLSLADGTAGDDPEDELKGIALRALWPKLISGTELFDRLTLPKKEYTHTSYERFVRSHLLEQVQPTDLPAALAWVARQPSLHKVPLFWREFILNVLARAWDAIDQPGLLPLFSEAVWSRLELHDPVARRSSDEKYRVLWEYSSPMRRPLIAEIVPLIAGADGKAIRLVFGETPLVFVDDIPWLLEKLTEAADEKTARVGAELIRRVFPRWEPKYVDEILAVTEKSPALKAEFEDLFQEVILDSDQARKLQEEHRERLEWAQRDRTKPRLDPPPQEALRGWLDRCEGEEPQAWWMVVRVMQLRLESTNWENDFESDLTELPGWKEVDDATRTRIVSGAARFLEAQAPNADEWFGTNQFTFPGIAGYKALRLLKSQAPDVYDRLNESIWRKWIPAVIGFPGLGGGDDTKAHAQILERAYHVVPDDVVKWVLLSIDRDNSQESFHHYHERFDFEWDERLRNSLMAKAKEPNLKPLVMKMLLRNLLRHGVDEALSYAASLVPLPVPIDEPARSRALEAARLLIQFAPDTSWKAVWSEITSDTNFGRELLESVALRHEPDEKPWGEHLSEEQMADLFLWLAKEYPPSGAPQHDGAYSVGPREAIVRLRDGVLSQIQDKATPGAVTALERVVKERPDIQWLKWVLIRAKDKTRQKAWSPPDPTDLLKLVGDHNKRFVESGEQLLAVVKESLTRLEQKLQGKGMVEFLWNKTEKGWRPKEEDAFSRYVADHLEDDIMKASIVINREVELRKGEYTDIHITADPRPGLAGREAEPIKVIIEAKGSWHRDVKIAMRSQLLETYLEDSTCRHGLYLVGWFNCAAWNMEGLSPKPPKWTAAEAQAEFDRQAAELSDGSRVIEAVVLNTALRSAR